MPGADCGATKYGWRRQQELDRSAKACLEQDDEATPKPESGVDP